METKANTLTTLLSQAEAVAKKKYQGHFGLLRFTTGWKAVFGTPILYTRSQYNWLYKLPIFDTPEDALSFALNAKPLPTCPSIEPGDSMLESRDP